MTDEEALKLLNDLALAGVCRGAGWTPGDGPAAAVDAIEEVRVATLQLWQRCFQGKEEGI